MDLLQKINAVSLLNFASISDGNHMSISDYFTESGIPYYRGGDIYNPFIEFTNSPLYIPKQIYNMPTMHRSHLEKGDILMSIVGAVIGNISIVSTNNNATCSCKLAIIRPQNISHAYLATFLKTKYGQQQIQKFRRGSGQTGLILEDFDQILVPLLDDKIVQHISNLVDKSLDCSLHKQRLYSEAESLLLEQLGLKNFTENKNTHNIISLNKSFVKSGRFDAEYYLPKYDDLFDRLAEHKTKRLSEIVSFKKSIEPGSDAYEAIGIPFIRVANLTKFGLTDTDVYLSIDEYADTIRPKKDTILLSKDGSVGIAYKVEEDIDVITSGAILHLTLTDDSVMPDYLTLVLNSIVVQMQAERDAGGSVIQHWKPSEIEKVVIPILDEGVQATITKKVQESFALRKESHRFLELAKQAVEVAIEQGEDKAMELLNKNI